MHDHLYYYRIKIAELQAHKNEPNERYIYYIYILYTYYEHGLRAHTPHTNSLSQ